MVNPFGCVLVFHTAKQIKNPNSILEAFYTLPVHGKGNTHDYITIWGYDRSAFRFSVGDKVVEGLKLNTRKNVATTELHFKAKSRALPHVIHIHSKLKSALIGKLGWSGLNDIPDTNPGPLIISGCFDTRIQGPFASFGLALGGAGGVLHRFALSLHFRESVRGGLVSGLESVFGYLNCITADLHSVFHLFHLLRGIMSIKSSDDYYGDTATGLNPRWPIYFHFLIAFFAEIGTPPQQR